MNSIADIGGMHGHGPVVAEPDEPTFHADWESRVLAITMATSFRGPWATDDFRFSIEQMDPAAYLQTSYYEHWLHALENLLVRRGIVTQQEIAAGRLMSSAKDDGQIGHVSAEACWPTFQGGGSLAMPAGEPVRYAVGDLVRARNIHPFGHTRLPRYVRGRLGTVVALHGGFAFADSRAAGTGDAPQHLYGVRFEAEELWGPDAGGRDAVYLDMYDAYLEPATS